MDKFQLTQTGEQVQEILNKSTLYKHEIVMSIDGTNKTLLLINNNPLEVNSTNFNNYEFSNIIAYSIVKFFNSYMIVGVSSIGWTSRFFYSYGIDSTTNTLQVGQFVADISAVISDTVTVY